MHEPEQIAKAFPIMHGDHELKMEGTAIHGGFFSVPLISHVVDNLYQGGCIGGARLPDEFDFVLSLYPWEAYDLSVTTERLEVQMFDSMDQGFEQVDELADLVVQHLERGDRVLVHCQAGLNRSGLLAAVALVKLGHTPDDAINLLRSKRCDMVLCNRAFEDHVRSLA